MTRRARRAKEVRRAILLLVLVALGSATIASAHIQGARPFLQRGQEERTIDLRPGALGVEAELSLKDDPLRHAITHTIDPSRGVYAVEHRADASRAADRSFAEWRFERLIEYRDLNVDGFFQPQTDAAVKAWRFSHYQWERAAIQRAQVADVSAIDIVWEGNLTGGPHKRVEIAIAGKAFSDEGAVVRAQDVAMYVDLTRMPPRGLGSLYAIEVSVSVPADATLRLHEASNASTALLADRPLSRALLVWGGEAVLDGTEQRIDATIEDERIDNNGNKTARLVLHLPTIDSSMRFVMVSGIEYLIEDKRSPAPGLAMLIGAMAILAVARRR